MSNNTHNKFTVPVGEGVKIAPEGKGAYINGDETRGDGVYTSQAHELSPGYDPDFTPDRFINTIETGNPEGVRIIRIIRSEGATALQNTVDKQF